MRDWPPTSSTSSMSPTPSPFASSTSPADLERPVHERLDERDDLGAVEVRLERDRLRRPAARGRGGGSAKSVRSERAHFARSAASTRRESATRSPANVAAGPLLPGGEEPVDDPVVEVHAAEEGVAAGRDDLVDVVVQLEHRGVEGAAAEVVHEDALVQVPPEGVGERRRRRLVQDPLDVEPRERRRRAAPPRAAARCSRRAR